MSLLEDKFKVPARLDHYKLFSNVEVAIKKKKNRNFLKRFIIEGVRSRLMGVKSG